MLYQLAFEASLSSFRYWRQLLWQI